MPHPLRFANIVVNKSRKVRWAGNIASMGGVRNMCTIVCELEGKKGPLERPRRKWEDNVRMGLGETGWDGGDWIHRIQVRDL
jgi:hypothetical protein